MRTCFVLVIFTAGLLRADSTILDTFHQPQTNCSYSLSSPYSNCDVIGDESKYDIEKITAEINGATTTVKLFFNYGGGSSLAPFTDVGLTLGVGDLFFFNPAHPDDYLYGVPLHDRGAFAAGDVYKIGSGITTLTADNIIHNTGYYYRRNEQVWLGGNGAPIQTGTVSVKNHGNGTDAANYEVDMTFSNPAGFLPNLGFNGNVGLAFASANCGNDVIKGTVSAVPEPGSVLLLGSMFLLLLPAMKRLAS